MAETKKHYFYDALVVRRQQQEYIRSLLKKFQNEAVSEELKKKVWEELQKEKHLGKVTIPFKLAVRRDPYGKFPDSIEVILDTKV
jgi:hypothetical protein